MQEISYKIVTIETVYTTTAATQNGNVLMTTSGRTPAKTLVVVGTGGTISSREAAGGGSIASDTAEDLIGSTTGLESMRIEADSLFMKNSYELTLEDMGVLAHRVAEHVARPEVAGVVVTHGTDTIEESAFLLELTHASDKPVVVTGAQRSADSPDSDGPANLRDSLVLAAAPAARGMGVLVQFSGTVYSSVGIRKVHTMRMNPFAVLNSGPIGYILDRQLVMVARPSRRGGVFPLPTEQFGNCRVEVVPTYPSADDALLRAAVASGARGVIIEGTGCGNANSRINAWIAEASSQGTVVALGTRVVSGPLLTRYAGGGGFDSVRAGAIGTGLLTVAQARTLLVLLLDLYPAEMAAKTFASYVSAAQKNAWDGAERERK
ncbi:MAG: asparaginase [Micrococcales bacterium]|nr:asparaginase [Micrococcales bacterium]